MTTALQLLEDETTRAAVGAPLDRHVMPQPVRAAYADPPYLGLAQAFYGKMHPQAAEYDDPETHRRLIERLSDKYDCWAMSLHEPALREILGMCPKDVRVASWVKPFASFKKHVTRAWTWEPVIFRFHRARPRPITERTWRDHVSAPIAMRKGFPGAKPDAFSFWVFEGLNLLPHDEFCDVFPGSGAVGDAWQRWKNREAPEQIELLGPNASLSGLQRPARKDKDGTEVASR